MFSYYLSLSEGISMELTGLHLTTVALGMRACVVVYVFICVFVCN